MDREYRLELERRKFLGRFYKERDWLEKNWIKIALALFCGFWITIIMIGNIIYP